MCELEIVAAKFVLDLGSPEEVIEEALVPALEAGGASLPSRVEAGRIVARVTARAFVAGTCEPVAGARSIWWDIVGEVPELLPELVEFIGLASEWEDDERHRPEYERDIIDAARALLDRGGAPPATLP